MAIPTDGELLMRFFRRKDEAAFETLVKRHQASVFAVCHRVLGNTHDAEDAFQATFLVLARRASKFEAAASVGGWLFRVALRTAKNVAVKKRRAKEKAIIVERSTSVDVLASIQQQEVVTSLYEELGKLPDKYRCPLVLCFLEGRSRIEAARQLDCTVPAIKARLSRAKRELRIRLTRRGVAFSIALSAASSVSRGAEYSLDALSMTTASNCSAFVSSKPGGTSVSTDVLTLSNEGLFAMKLAAITKLGTAALLASLIATSSVTISRLGTSKVQAEDNDAITIAIQKGKEAAQADLNVTAGLTNTTPDSAFNVISQIARQSGIFSAEDDFMMPNNQSTNESKKKHVSEKVANAALRALIDALNDDEPNVRYGAIKTLARIGNGSDDVIDAFGAVLARTDDEKLRYYAVSGLGVVGRGSEKAVRVLSGVAKDDKTAVFRKAAVTALGQIGRESDDATMAVVEALKDKDDKVRIAATEVLGRIQLHSSDNRHPLRRPTDLSLPEELNDKKSNATNDLFGGGASRVR